MNMIKFVSQLRGALLGIAMVVGFIGSAMTQPAPLGVMSEVKGTIAQYSLSPRGVVDGLILVDGTEIRLPRHISTQLASNLRPGDTVTIRWLQTAASRDMTMATVTNDATGSVVDASASVATSQIND